MSTRIIAVLNQKGGVGKTTTTVNLGAALARRGQEVLLLDLDPQANLTVHVGVDPRSLSTDPSARSSYSLLLGRHNLADAIRPTSTPGLSVLPSTLALANAEIQLASAVGRELILRDALEEWMGPQPSPKADYVLIDCPPSLGILTMNALCASTDVLLPIQAEFFALQGVAGILESLKAVQRLNRNLKLSLVVPCLVDKRKTLAREILDEVRRYFGNLVTKTMVRVNVKLAEAPSHGKTIFEYDAASNGAKDYESLAAEVLGDAEVPSDDEEREDETGAEPATSASEETADPVEHVAETTDTDDSPQEESPTEEIPVAELSATEELAAEEDELVSEETVSAVVPASEPILEDVSVNGNGLAADDVEIEQSVSSEPSSDEPQAAAALSIGAEVSESVVFASHEAPVADLVPADPESVAGSETVAHEESTVDAASS